MAVRGTFYVPPNLITASMSIGNPQNRRHPLFDIIDNLVAAAHTHKHAHTHTHTTHTHTHKLASTHTQQCTVFLTGFNP